jgi:dienelactone hydrolase
VTRRSRDTLEGKKHNLPLVYDAKADEQSWAEMTKFLEALFPPS